MTIHEALELIQEWINSLEDEELPEVCRKSGNDFFAFLKRRGFAPGTFVNAVYNATGYRPQNLWRAEDAAMLRRAIAGYESTSFELSHEEYRYGQTNDEWLRNATARYFGE